MELPRNHFNPLPPHGGRPAFCWIGAIFPYFNPLPPHGGRLALPVCHFCILILNPPPPIGGRRNCGINQVPAEKISIHSLRMEGDGICHAHRLFAAVFQSTPSVWRETRLTCRDPGQQDISIHSLRMEGDSFNPLFRARLSHFNPLPPYGGRLLPHQPDRPNCHFNPLPPYGGRLVSRAIVTYCRIFQSTPSVWRETRNSPEYRTAWLFQSTPSVWRETY